MIGKLPLCVVASACIVFQASMPNGSAFAKGSFGGVGGVARDSASGKPLARAQIVAHNIEKGTDRTAVSGADGAFSIADLEPGHYEVAAAKDGFRKFSASIDVAELQIVRVDLLLAPGAVTSATNAEAAPTITGAPVSTPALSVAQELEAMKKRIEQLEAELKNRTIQEQQSSPGPKAAVEASVQPVPASKTPLPADGLANPEGTSSSPANTEIAVNVAPQTPQGTQGTLGKGVVPAAQSQAPASPAADLQTPFADADWSWLNGTSRQHDSPLDSKYFTGEFRADTFYGLDFNQPKDHSMGGSSEVFRNGEVQLEDLSIGGDFHAGNMRGRVLALFGLFSATTVRNDASPAVGQWDVRAAYKYVSEAYGGYHFNVQHGLNIDAGIFVSYVGLFSYHNFDNWAYQPSYVSSNTPWFFNGVRVQWFPTNHLKIEPWFINGWQAYNKFNGHPGVGGQIKWTPKPWLEIVGNQYGVGNDNIGLPHRARYHTDDSIEIKYYDRPSNGLNRMAFSLTGDMGCETGQGVTCHGGKGGPKQSFLGWMAYNRFWFKRDTFGVTLGGGAINNPGRYLALVLPVNGADAISGTPYFPAYPGAPFKAWDSTATFDYMPSQFATFRMEFGYRHSNVPYWSGRNGITPPGGNNGAPANYVCANGSNSGYSDMLGAQTACGGGASSLWSPDLRKGQALLMFSIMVKL